MHAHVHVCMCANIPLDRWGHAQLVLNPLVAQFLCHSHQFFKSVYEMAELSGMFERVLPALFFLLSTLPLEHVVLIDLIKLWPDLLEGGRGREVEEGHLCIPIQSCTYIEIHTSIYSLPPSLFTYLLPTCLPPYPPFLTSFLTSFLSSFLPLLAAAWFDCIVLWSHGRQSWHTP